MTRIISRLLARARDELERRCLGVTAEEIRYTFDDVRGELRASRAELLQEIARLREQIDRMAAREEQQRGTPVAEA